MTGFTVRAATLYDAPAIAAIYRPFVETTASNFELAAPNSEEIARRMAEVFEHGLPYLVAEADGVIAGYAYASPFRPRAAYRFTLEDSIYIDPSMSRRGIGRLLLTALIEQCRAAGYREMIAAMGGDNPASIALHEALGFKHVGVLRKVGFKFDQWLDVTLMQLDL